MNLLKLKAEREFGENKDSLEKLVQSSEKYSELLKLLGGIE